MKIPHLHEWRDPYESIGDCRLWWIPVHYPVLMEGQVHARLGGEKIHGVWGRANNIEKKRGDKRLFKGMK